MVILKNFAREVEVLFEENEVTEKWRSFVSESKYSSKRMRSRKIWKAFVRRFPLFFKEKKVAEPSLPSVRTLKNTSERKRSRSFLTLREYVAICFENNVATVHFEMFPEASSKYPTMKLRPQKF